MDRQQQVNDFRDTIQDSKNKDFEFNISYKVPSINDTDLTYESGKTKKGKEITTCVLYVDIRNSVALTEKHQIKTKEVFVWPHGHMKNLLYCWCA
jgi:hypothetical protein